MSRAATDWAWSQSIKPATHKLILLSMADRADEYHCCYPSIARLEKDTGLDRKTIQKGVAAMIENGLITDTGKRTGATNQVRVLRLNIGVEVSQKRDSSAVNKQPKNGKVTENGNNPKNGIRNDPNFGMGNDPKNGIQNQSIEPPIEPLPPSGVNAHAREDAPNDESAQSCPASKPAKRTDRATRIPADFPLTDEMRAWAAEECCSFDLDREHKKFRDYWAAAGGSKARKVDWMAAWRNWMRKADEDWSKRNFGGRNGTYQQSNRKLTPVEQFHEAERQWAESQASGASAVGAVEDGQFREV